MYLQSVENVITLGKFDRPVVFILSPPPPLYYVFENSKNKRNDLAHPVMGTIFLFCSFGRVLHKNVIPIPEIRLH